MLNFAEQFFPARPKRLVARVRTLAYKPIKVAPNIKIGLPNATNSTYVNWLKKESMLDSANKLAKKYSGHSHMWRNPYAKPQPRAAVKKADVWFTAYPMSHTTKSNESILASFSDKQLWQVFKKIGINGLHTGPIKLAGGQSGWDFTPSIDGHFDRISSRLDPAFGTEKEFRHLSNVASQHDGIVIDDIVPGHTGKGPDFRLAEMSYGEYPGIYHMVEIDQKDWGLLPDVPKGQDSVNISSEVEQKLKNHRYIIGKLPRVIFYEKGIKETNWSVTKVVRGVDGIRRRWVYLHYFKSGQPTINWLDPSFAGMKLVIGDALHSLGELGTKGLRLDANGFLGIETAGDDQPAWSEGHPLSEAANLMIAGTVRKLGGFTFQELNLSFEDIKVMSESGADLSYDFINRPAYHHALATADTEFLRLTLKSALHIGIDPASLVHALQNHDDLTYELVHFWTIHKDDIYDYHGKEIKGQDLRLIIRSDLQTTLSGAKAPYNLLFTENGLACTTTSIITAILGITDLQNISKKDIRIIIRIHLLLVMFNAWQPGVLALSGWDLAGSLPLKSDDINHLIADGDTRWISRGSYDLLGLHQTEKVSAIAGMPRSRSLYGSLPEQLENPDSFACGLSRILEVRRQSGIATAHQLDIPDVSHKSLLVMVHKMENDNIQLTVLNFGQELIEGTIHSQDLPAGATIRDIETHQEIGVVDELHNFSLTIEAYGGIFLNVKK